jgi:hypothetical protein
MEDAYESQSRLAFFQKKGVQAIVEVAMFGYGDERNAQFAKESPVGSQQGTFGHQEGAEVVPLSHPQCGLKLGKAVVISNFIVYRFPGMGVLLAWDCEVFGAFLGQGHVDEEQHAAAPCGGDFVSVEKE